jgi:enolase
MKIARVNARQILDSRGNPTVEADVILENNILGRAAVPSGASTGTNEALELRDNDMNFYDGKGVLKAVENIKSTISQALTGEEVENQLSLDNKMINLDGTNNKSKLGANAILAVSLACAKAAALTQSIPLYQHIHQISGNKSPLSLPMPMINIVNGGAHANFASDIQEFMIIPISAKSFSQAIQMSAEVFHALGHLIKDQGYSTSVGDEGGYAPILRHGNLEALDMITQSITNSKYKLGKDFALGLDIAATQFYKEGKYFLKADNQTLETSAMIDWVKNITEKYAVISVEDGLAESDWEGWTEMTTQIGDKVELVGDDLLVTNSTYLQKAIDSQAGNAILIKPNQIGTLSETIATTLLAKQQNWKTIISHRSGETEDTTIAHLAVGLGTNQIKSGSLSRTERTAKYNELLRIEEVLGAQAFLAAE